MGQTARCVSARHITAVPACAWRLHGGEGSEPRGPRPRDGRRLLQWGEASASCREGLASGPGAAGGRGRRGAGAVLSDSLHSNAARARGAGPPRPNGSRTCGTGSRHLRPDPAAPSPTPDQCCYLPKKVTTKNHEQVPKCAISRQAKFVYALLSIKTSGPFFRQKIDR